MLIVGLGNPGERYEWTRHNLGFMLVDLLARQSNAQVKRSECRALVGRAEVEGRAVELVKPQTYMNLSGESVACLLRKRERLKTADGLLVVSDDIALPFGSIRLRARGITRPDRLHAERSGVGARAQHRGVDRRRREEAESDHGRMPSSSSDSRSSSASR